MKKIVFILMLGLTVGCNGQDKNTSPVIEKEQDTITDSIVFNRKNPDVPEKWKGAEKFSNKNIINKKVSKEEFVSGDTITIQWERESQYYQEKSILKDSIKIRKHFDKKTLNCVYEGVSFYGVGIGTHKRYSPQGKLISAINNDDKIPISVPDFIHLIKTKSLITFNEPELDIRRFPGNDSIPPKYRITHHFENDYNKFRWIIINGATGEVIEDITDFIRPD